MNRRRVAARCAVAIPVLLGAAAVLAAPVFAQEVDGPVLPAVDSGTVGLNLNLLWIIIGAMLVIFMQAGFAMVETGFCRAKHAAHVVTTNFMIFGLGFVGFLAIGFPLMFGGYTFPGVWGMDKPIGGALLGSGNWVFLWKGPLFLGGSGPSYTPAVMAFFLYMVAFMDTTATIPTGSMAERWKWNSFVVWGVFCGALYYPLFGAWTWAAAGCRRSVRPPTGASAMSTSRAPASCTPPAVSLRSPVPSCWVPASASSAATASPGP